MKKTSIVVLLNLIAAIFCLGLQAKSADLSMHLAFAGLPWDSFLTGLAPIATANASVASADLLAAWLALSVLAVFGSALQYMIRKQKQQAVSESSVSASVNNEISASTDRFTEPLITPGLASVTDQVLDPQLRDEIKRLESALAALTRSAEKSAIDRA